MNLLQQNLTANTQSAYTTAHDFITIIYVHHAPSGLNVQITQQYCQRYCILSTIEIHIHMNAEALKPD